MPIRRWPPDREAAAWLAQQALLNLETGWAATYFAPGDPGDTWTFDADGVASSATAAGLFDPRDAGNNQILQWNDASSTPIEDIRRAKRTVGEATGFRPNTLVLGRPVFDMLLDHGDIVGRLDRGQTAGPAMATRDSLAALLEVANHLRHGRHSEHGSRRRRRCSFGTSGASTPSSSTRRRRPAL